MKRRAKRGALKLVHGTVSRNSRTIKTNYFFRMRQADARLQD